MMPCILIDK